MGAKIRPEIQSLLAEWRMFMNAVFFGPIIGPSSARINGE
jgi:hypothetical protein